MRSFGVTNIGRYRLKNDDSFFCSDGRRSLYIVADGMGGYQGGETASKIAVSTAVELLRHAETLDKEMAKKLTLEIQKRMREAIDRNENLKDMGTTFVCALIVDGIVYLMHIGDSRAYLVRGGILYQMTEDHTLVNILYRNGVIDKEQARVHPKRNVLVKALSAYEKVEGDLKEFEMGKEDTLLLCTDGLTDQLTNGEILDILLLDESSDVIASKLVDTALKSGARDNIAVVVVKGSHD
ncbi:MAG TPA: Stp1/IreP family PP2C-type Ser/Thr phosphatase [Tissierellia bacterium]|jgi:serine/threonine protein phosphatase PrpC|nr:Stp1/IreP family PP2C-type Ser/Thr phosphatase [Tissierellia bacterium]